MVCRLSAPPIFYDVINQTGPGAIQKKREGEKNKKKTKTKTSQRVAIGANFDFKSYARGVQRQTSFFFGLNQSFLKIYHVTNL